MTDPELHIDYHVRAGLAYHLRGWKEYWNARWTWQIIGVSTIIGHAECSCGKRVEIADFDLRDIANQQGVRVVD